jgi:hypothetical protein
MCTDWSGGITTEETMGKITLDIDLRNKLNGLDAPMEICDEAGHTVGHFLPASVYDELFYKALAAESPRSEEELKRRHQQVGGRSLAEIWKRLSHE